MDEAVKDDFGYLVNEQIKLADAILKGTIGTVEGALPLLAANLIATEFELGQAKADAWAEVGAMKLREDRVEATAIALAASEGLLEGRNTDQRKQKLESFKYTNHAILDAKTTALSMRNMSDCLTNAHLSVGHALKLVMALIEGQS